MAVFTGMTFNYLLRFVHADLDWRKCISTFQVAINLAKRFVFFYNRRSAWWTDGTRATRGTQWRRKPWSSCGRACSRLAMPTTYVTSLTKTASVSQVLHLWHLLQDGKVSSAEWCSMWAKSIANREDSNPPMWFNTLVNSLFDIYDVTRDETLRPEEYINVQMSFGLSKGSCEEAYSNFAPVSPKFAVAIITASHHMTLVIAFVASTDRPVAASTNNCCCSTSTRMTSRTKETSCSECFRRKLRARRSTTASPTTAQTIEKRKLGSRSGDVTIYMNELW